METQGFRRIAAICVSYVKLILNTNQSYLKLTLFLKICQISVKMPFIEPDYGT